MKSDYSLPSQRLILKVLNYLHRYIQVYKPFKNLFTVINANMITIYDYDISLLNTSCAMTAKISSVCQIYI